MGLFDSLIAALIGKKVADKVFDEGCTVQRPSMPAFNSERAYLNRVTTKVDEQYVNLDFTMPFSDAPNAMVQRCLHELKTMDDNNRFTAERLYSNVKGQPNYLRWRLNLLRHLLIAEEDGDFTYTLVHNELLYIINNFLPTTETEEMVKTVCCFLDAEYYFAQGDFLSSLKRLYEALSWERFRHNEWYEERIIGNELQDFEQAILLNIINIYALIGSPEKASETRNAFNTLYFNTKQHNRDVNQTAMRELSRSSKYMEYMQMFDMAFDASSDFVGWTSLKSEVAGSDDIMSDMVLGNYGGVQSYNIHPTFFHEKKYTSIEELDGTERPAFVIMTYCTITDFHKKAEAAKQALPDLFRE